MFCRTAGLRHDVGEKFTKALSRTDLLGSSAPCLLAVLALVFACLACRGQDIALRKFDVRSRKPPNFIFLKAVNAVKNASLPLFARN